MSETSSTSSYVDITSETWEEYFGATEGSETIVDILKMTAEEWEVLIGKYGADTVSEYLSAQTAEIEEKGLEAIIGGTIHDLEEINTDGEYDTIIAELEELSENCDLQPLEDAISTYNLANVDLREQSSTYTFTEDPEVTAGTVYTYEYAESMDLETFYLYLEDGTTMELASYDPATGEYIFRCTNEDGVIFYLKFTKVESTASETGTMVSDPHPDWYDSDGDGYGDLELEYDAKGNLATDLNGDGVVNQADVELAEGHEGFDIVLTGGSGNLTEAELASWPDDLSQHFYESSATQASGMSAYNALEGIDPSTSSDFETYYLDTYGPNSVDIDLSTNTAQDITIECEPGVTDTINITNLPADAQFSVVDGALVITIPSTGQTITIKGWEAGTATPDIINISGTGLTSAISTGLHYTSSGGAVVHGSSNTPSQEDYTDPYSDCLSSIICVNGSTNSSDYDYWTENMEDEWTTEQNAAAKEDA